MKLVPECTPRSPPLLSTPLLFSSLPSSLRLMVSIPFFFHSFVIRLPLMAKFQPLSILMARMENPLLYLNLVLSYCILLRRYPPPLQSRSSSFPLKPSLTYSHFLFYFMLFIYSIVSWSHVMMKHFVWRPSNGCFGHQHHSVHKPNCLVSTTNFARYLPLLLFPFLWSPSFLLLTITTFLSSPFLHIPYYTTTARGTLL